MYCINFLREKKRFPDRPTVISVTGGTRNKELILDGPMKKLRKEMSEVFVLLKLLFIVSVEVA